MDGSSVRHERVVPSGAAANGTLPSRRDDQRLWWVEATMAALAFATMCVLVLTVAAETAEPDDGAYRASIAAINKGHLLTMSTAEARALAASLHDNPAAPPNQWVEVTPGRYISEKDPGYPFLAAPFEMLGIIRWAPLWFGALACVGLFAGARRWLGPFGGAAAVGLYCSSGAALAFAWRDYMPTFTDASLVAAGAGLLLWALLATETGSRRRTGVGLAAFLALEAATFVRYTNLVLLACAVVTVVVLRRRRASTLPAQALWWWLSSVAAFGVGVAAFDTVAYGGPLTSGYRPGEITFALRAVAPNLHVVPPDLLHAMPMLLPGTVSVLWIVVRRVALRLVRDDGTAGVRRDLDIGLALAGSSLAIWAVYLTYTWTTDPTSVTVQVVRFYVPALGPIALLGAWLVTRLPGRQWLTGLVTAAATATFFAQGTQAFHAMYAAFGVPLHS